MIQNFPILVDNGEKTIHLIGDFSKVRWKVIPHIDWLLTVTSSKLRNIGDSCVVQSPKGVFIEKFDSLIQSNLNAVRQQIILPQKVLLLNFCVKGRTVFFSDGHREKGPGKGTIKLEVLYASKRV